MNEQIRALAIQVQRTEMPGVLFAHPEFVEKFAELLIRECMQLADNEASRFYNMNEDNCASAMENYYELVKQHFGVRNEQTT